MDTDKTENTDALAEEQETEVSEPSEAEQETSNKNTESEKEEETPEPEEGPEETKKEEETFDHKVSRLAKSMADKSLKTYQQKAAEQAKQIETLTAQLNEKTWDKTIEGLFGEESESKGEDTAVKLKAGREELKKQVLEYQKNQAYVNRVKPELEKRESALNFVERDQKARDEVWKLLFPDDSDKVSKVAALVKRFEKAQDMEDFEIIIESLKSELKAKSGKKTFVPDSGNQGGGGSDLKNLSPLEKITRGLKKEIKTIGG